ncbi:class I SAM-dependent rRNA methyltransferase [Legionella maceachernii]|uniref:SAM-dependent methyltransferase n=1 Tax=Legionella maceachernii TaxID=466 RepID=A0A0W0VYP9_9GAMM|nr:class I SAM-dependent rRNA methyltransferase [Legionella maceachernii]KTD25224.1 SAM-dependent methyltransferase [Legionella maceachernii]SJZ76785.1 23S rRNA (cytosine1962-C5)-methyltransferase [Legionella maceachernii]SUP03086.1 Ribosomal RNA large subunit methyltransferase I [Legionella maceachernii]
MKAAVYLHKAKQNTVRRGHPWIFPKAIAKTSGELATGELVDIFSAEGELLGVGAYNEHSLYRVRVLALQHESMDTQSLSSIITQRLRQALAVRQALNLPNEMTTAYRLFNSEADGLSGLTVDRFEDISVVASSAYWVEANKQMIRQGIQALFPKEEVIWLSQEKPLAQDGWHQQAESMSGKKIKVLEAGVIYQIDFSQAQKTGLFLDQRENHQRVAALAQGKRVLDLYSYTGGFALHAAKAGAIKITAVDSSAQAITQAKENARLNNLDIEFIEADARDHLAQAGDYDLIILDPPKLVPSQRHLERAKNYYRFLHREIFKAMKPGSLLMTCNCSSALTTQEFSILVSSQAAAAGKQARLLGIFGPASCHPTLASFPEGNYLTAILLAVV